MFGIFHGVWCFNYILLNGIQEIENILQFYVVKVVELKLDENVWVLCAHSLWACYFASVLIS